MSSIYPINPSSGGASPVFNGSNNGLVPNPGGGLPNRVLNANGTWAAPPVGPTVVLSPNALSATLGGVTWSSTWADPLVLSCSANMYVARMFSNLYSVSLGANAVDVTLSSASGQLMTRNRWAYNLSSITFGAYSASWNCDFYGIILVNSTWFMVIGGASLNANVADMMIVKMT